MKKKYFLITATLLCLLFSSVETTYGQTKKPSKREQRAQKKRAAKRTAVAPTPAGKSAPTPVLTPKSEPSVASPKSESIGVKPELNTNTNTSKVNDITKDAKDLVITKPNGNINWTQQYIEATGQSVIDNERFKNAAQAKLMATRGAVVVAQRNLLEIVKGVQIIGETTMQDMITTSDYIYSRVEGVVKGAQQIGEAKEKDGYIEVRLRMPIYGAESLANTLDDESLALARQKNGYEKSPLLAQEPTSGEGIDGSKPIVFNVENQGQFDPSMYPMIVDENGKVLFDFSQYFRLKDGKFPQYLQLGKEVLQAYGNQKGVDIINMIQTGKGEFQIPKKSSKNVFWNRVARIAQDVGAVLFKLIF
jgi:hypothetical protein